ncbi:unnamed protein product [Rodentolepis nana]|uniref:Golgi apparatus membrane protein TVP23 n=1 Tax=Rodentolepis nana TaxID=102285 RepID=A0A0R3TYH7_RODNA|nr:unnamed protein product [Rodentolepis nana]
MQRDPDKDNWQQVDEKSGGSEPTSCLLASQYLWLSVSCLLASQYLWLSVALCLLASQYLSLSVVVFRTGHRIRAGHRIRWVFSVPSKLSNGFDSWPKLNSATASILGQSATASIPGQSVISESANCSILSQSAISESATVHYFSLV